MMQNKGKICILLVAIFMVSLFAGCAENKKEKQTASVNTAVVEPISKDENKKIIKLIRDYFTDVYAKPIESYTNAAASGIVPEELKKYIARTTLTVGEGNPEIPIHFPRKIEMNRQIVNRFELLKVGEAAEEPDIQADFVQKQGESWLYLVKISLKAITNGDEMKLQAHYHVNVVQEKNEFKILKSVEANKSSTQKNRLQALNNEFVTKLPYLNLQRKEEQGSYLWKEDGKIFEKEKAVIQGFFDEVLKLDAENMKLLNHVWNSGDLSNFNIFLEKIGLNKDKDGKKILSVGEDYKEKFDYYAFPLHSNLGLLSGMNDFTVTLHPAYSSKNKRYFVTFKAFADRKDLIAEQKLTYHFDYTVELTELSGNPTISGFYLNESYKL